MRTNATLDTITATSSAANAVTISRWVNQPLPDLREILCSRDLARLTRRPWWILCGLALVGKFPRKKRFRGPLVGWCRAEVLDWVSRDLTLESANSVRPGGTRYCARQQPQQACLPLECGPQCIRAKAFSRQPRNSVSVNRRAASALS